MLPSRPTSACGNPPRRIGGADPEDGPASADRHGGRVDDRVGHFHAARRFGAATGVLDALIAWAVAGGGMFTLARVFQPLAQRKPDLDAGVYPLVAGWISI